MREEDELIYLPPSIRKCKMGEKKIISDLIIEASLAETVEEEREIMTQILTVFHDMKCIPDNCVEAHINKGFDYGRCA